MTKREGIGIYFLSLKELHKRDKENHVFCLDWILCNASMFSFKKSFIFGPVEINWWLWRYWKNATMVIKYSGQFYVIYTFKIFKARYPLALKKRSSIILDSLVLSKWALKVDCATTFHSQSNYSKKASATLFARMENGLKMMKTLHISLAQLMSKWAKLGIIYPTEEYYYKPNREVMMSHWTSPQIFLIFF